MKLSDARGIDVVVGVESHVNINFSFPSVGDICEGLSAIGLYVLWWSRLRIQEKQLPAWEILRDLGFIADISLT